MKVLRFLGLCCLFAIAVALSYSIGAVLFCVVPRDRS